MRATIPIDRRLAPVGTCETINAGRTEYDVLIERWNRMSATARTARAAQCRVLGHDWQPLSDGTAVCGRCAQYDGLETM